MKQTIHIFYRDFIDSTKDVHLVFVPAPGYNKYLTNTAMTDSYFPGFKDIKMIMSLKTKNLEIISYFQVFTFFKLDF